MKPLVRPVVVLLGFLTITACGLREHKGEDLNRPTDQELAEFRNKLRYTKDASGTCYAVLSNDTYGFRTTLTFSAVGCGGQSKLPTTEEGLWSFTK